MDVVVEYLTKSFQNKKAVDSISFSAKKGEILGFLGPNGAGKTTTMRILSGFLYPDSGDIHYGNDSFRKHPAKIKRIIGYLAEHNPLYNEMNVIDFLLFIAKLHDIPRYKITARILDMLHLCGLENEKHKLIRELSRGYRQRLGMAQALIHDPEILILDEPTTGLDPNQIIEIREIIKNVKEDKTIIFSSHLLSEIERTCDRVMIMSKGVIVADGTAAELRKKSDSETYLKIIIHGEESGIIHNALQQIPQIKNIILLERNTYNLEYAQGSEIEKTIFELCSNNNWYIKELTPLQTRLEDIFHKVTQN